MSALAKGRMSVAAGCVGIAQAALDAAVAYAGEREQFGKPIARHQLVQELISDIAVDVDAARLLTWRVADLIDRGEAFATESSKAKLFASEAAVRCANNALQVFGGYGYIDEYPVGKLLRDARVMTLYEGTSQIQKLHHRPRAHRGLGLLRPGCRAGCRVDFRVRLPGPASEYVSEYASGWGCAPSAPCCRP